MHKHESAFTLIELMIAIAVAAVVLTLGVPGFNNVMQRNQLTAHINELVSTLHFARSEAVRRNTSVKVCHSADGVNCGGAGYEEGWIIFIDDNGNDVWDDPDEELIRVNEGISSNFTMRASSLNTFSFNSKGRVSPAIGGRVVLCKDNSINQSRAIVISNSGRTRLAKLDSNGAPEIAPGIPMGECIPPWT